MAEDSGTTDFRLELITLILIRMESWLATLVNINILLAIKRLDLSARTSYSFDRLAYTVIYVPWGNRDMKPDIA